MFSVEFEGVGDFSEGEVSEVGESVLGKLKLFVFNDVMSNVLCGKASSSKSRVEGSILGSNGGDSWDKLVELAQHLTIK